MIDYNYTSLFSAFSADSISKIEWSIEISHSGIVQRKKPSFILKNDTTSLNELTHFLKRSEFPEEIIQFQIENINNALYQIIKIPENTNQYATICTHPKEDFDILGLSWNNEKITKRTYYFVFNPEWSFFSKKIHSDLTAVYNELLETVNTKDAGIWIQEEGTQLHKEIYTDFLQPISFKTIAKSLPNNFNITATDFHPYEMLSTKNIGFQGLESKNPKTTVYFQFPIQNIVPKNYEELVVMTKEYFTE